MIWIKYQAIFSETNNYFVENNKEDQNGSVTLT